ncbi:hypothetical protein [Desulfuromonas sp. CSMB_57]|uniref:hypothetical protein n=1 Tax=Desulfuromonas sp. CSMB_57 TaxID=2807629 RepID=UPI001CD65575|nr:hypothetical protein [Desulfuromonas sp. CSMB_57]
MKYAIIIGLLILSAVAQDVRALDEPMLVECRSQLEMWRNDRITPGLAEKAMQMECPDPYARVMPVFKKATSSSPNGSHQSYGSSRDDEERARQERERLARERLETERQQAFDKAKQQLLHSIKGGSSGTPGLGLKTAGSAGQGLALKSGTPPVVTSTAQTSTAVRQEQHAFDNTQAEWLRRQQELIRQSVAYDNKWRNEVLASIKAIRVPNPAARPKELEDLRPGDVLLIGPDDSSVAGAIKRADPLYRALDSLVSPANVSSEELRYGKASHVLTFVRKVKEELLFLDHTLEGSRIINEVELIRRYGNRPVYIAKPQAQVDGRKLWEVAREAALQRASDYGLLGSSVVCSERAAIAVAKATGVAMDKERHLFGLGAVDITPADFFDDKHVGRFFLVSTRPIVLRGR